MRCARTEGSEATRTPIRSSATVITDTPPSKGSSPSGRSCSRATNTDVSRIPVRSELVDRRAGDRFEIGGEGAIERRFAHDALNVRRRQVLLGALERDQAEHLLAAQPLAPAQERELDQ